MSKGVIRLLVMVCALGVGRTAAQADPTVTLSASATAVAKGGSITLTTTVVPNTYVDFVLVTYEDEETEDILTSAPYVVNHTFDILGTITVTATVFYTDQTPYGQDTIDIDVVGLQISGSTTPLRGYTTVYLAQSAPTGKAIDQFNWTYAASGEVNYYQDNDNDNDNKSYWSGKMVVTGTLACSATVSGVAVSKSLPITISPRSWSTPITCAQDNEANWGAGITASDPLGQNRQKDEDAPALFFTPWDETYLWNSARTLSKVTSGPCTDWWYVSASTLVCQRETVINQYIKQNGPAPSGAEDNFYTINAAICEGFDSDNFVQAFKNHEYRGTPDTARSWEGHQGRTEYAILTSGYDAKQNIEDLTARDEESLSSAVTNSISSDNSQVADYANDEGDMSYYGPNWGAQDPQALGSDGHNRWNVTGESWNQNCSDGPTSF